MTSHSTLTQTIEPVKYKTIQKMVTAEAKTIAMKTAKAKDKKLKCCKDLLN
jgi:hypothetical protein